MENNNKPKEIAERIKERRELRELTEENRRKVASWFEQALLGQEIVFE